MNAERRKAKRVGLSLDTCWHNNAGRYTGIIRDLSKNGCFIMTTEPVNKGMAVEVEIKLPSVFHMTLKGSIVNTRRNVGFALIFKELKVTEQLLLERLLTSHKS